MPTTVSTPFRFKQFVIEQDVCPMKVGTDGILLGAWANVKDAQTALDIGTGTGLIAIMLGQRNEKVNIHAVEIDEVACEQAKKNMKAAPWSNRLKAFSSSIQDFTQSATQKYDLIVSNPPFFSGGTFSDNQDRNRVRHTIKMPHGDLLIAVRQLLTNDGKFSVILPFIEGLRFIEIAKTYHLSCTRKTEVFPKKDKSVERLLLQFEKNEKALEEDQLVIQVDGANDWTPAFKALTEDFYL